MDTSNLLKKEWVYIYTRRMTYQKVRLYYYGFSNGIFGYKLNYELYRFKNGDMFNYHEKNEEIELSKYLLSKILDKKFAVRNFKNLEKDINKDFNEYLSFIKSLSRNASKLTNSDLCKILEEYYKKENKLSIRFWALFSTVEVVFIKAVKKLFLNEGINNTESQKIISELSEPIKIIPLDMERLSLLNIALLKGKKQRLSLSRHAQKFSYIPMYDIDYKPYDIDYFQDTLKKITRELSAKEITEEIDVIERKYKNRYNRYLKIISKFENNAHLFSLLKFFAAYSYLKDFKPFVRDTGNFYIRRVFEELAKRLNLSLAETLFLNEGEIPKILNKKLVISKAELDNRINNSAYFCDKGNIYLETDKDKIAEIDKVLNKKEETKELRGTGVSLGSAVGKVFIILSNNDFNKFKEDGVLVTSATRPDFVPIMKKACAIVTDEGGILSHAAIVSRELKKPCIVGTKIATKVLKDGDLVEVDANKGIVKIIKKG